MKHSTIQKTCPEVMIWNNAQPQLVFTVLLQSSNWNTKKKICEICLKLTAMTPGRRNWRRSGVIVVNLKQISYIVLVFLLPFWTIIVNVFIVNFGQIYILFWCFYWWIWTNNYLLGKFNSYASRISKSSVICLVIM